MAHMSNCSVGGRDRFRQGSTSPKNQLQHWWRKVRFSQNGGSTDRLAYSFHAMPHRAYVKVSYLKGGTVGNSQWNPRFVKTFRLELEPVLGWNRTPTKTDYPLGSVGHIHHCIAIGKKVHSCATLKYCSSSPFFACEIALGYVKGAVPGSETFPTFSFLGHSSSVAAWVKLCVCVFFLGCCETECKLANFDIYRSKTTKFSNNSTSQKVPTDSQKVPSTVLIPNI